MLSSHRSQQNPAIDQVAAWASAQPDIVALALVGSWARGNPTKRSDIDFMVISETPKQRLAEIR
jgi:predicted nucleotidyltransferase